LKPKEELSGKEDHHSPQIIQKRTQAQLKRLIKRKLNNPPIEEKWLEVFNFIDCLRKVNKYQRPVINALSKHRPLL